MFLLSMKSIIYGNEAKHAGLGACVTVRTVKDAHKLLNRGKKTSFEEEEKQNPQNLQTTKPTKTHQPQKYNPRTKPFCLYKISCF